MNTFVINSKNDAPDMVHRTDCRTIRHQVAEEEKQGQAAPTYEYLGKNEDGHSIVLKRFGPHVSRYVAQYATIAQLQAWPRRYRRCQHCSPDVPESIRVAQPDRHSMQARSIKESHLGREFVGVGSLLSVRMSIEGYELTGTDGVLRVPLDGRVDYLKQVPPRAPLPQDAIDPWSASPN